MEAKLSEDNRIERGILVGYTTEARIHRYGRRTVTALLSEEDLLVQLRDLKRNYGAADNSIIICTSADEAFEMGDNFYDNRLSENDWYGPEELCEEYGIEALYSKYTWIAYKTVIDLSDRFFSPDISSPFEYKRTETRVARLDCHQSIDTQLDNLGADEAYLCASMSEAFERIKAWDADSTKYDD